MKHLLRYTLLFTVIIIVTASCKKAVPDQAKYIPKDALFVVDLDWKGLSDKAEKGHISWDSLFRSATSSPGDTGFAEAKKKIDEFMKSGIDEQSHVFFFIKTGGSIMSGQSTSAGIVVGMKDAAVFESYLKKQPGAGEIKKESSYSYITLDNNLFVGWNKDVAVLSGSQMNYSAQGTSNTEPKNALTTLFALKEEESVASIPEFADLMKEKGDILFFTNSSGALNSVPLLGMTKFADLLKDSYGAGVVNFEDGKVNASFKSYSGKDLAEIWKKYAGPTVDIGMVEQYPLPVDGYAVFSFNPQIISEIIKYGGFESTANEFLGKEGLTVDDIVKAFKGDFAIVFSDISAAQKEVNYEGMQIMTKQPTARLIFNAKIGDKTAYDKIVKKLLEEGVIIERNGQYVPAVNNFDVAWHMDDKNLLVATDSTLLQQYLAAKGNAKIPADIKGRSTGKSFAMYIDINKIIQSFPPDSANRQAFDAARGAFKNVIASSDNFNGKYVGSTIELNTMQASENSLVTLVRFFSSVADELKEQHKKLKDDDMVDMDMDMDMDTDEMDETPPAGEPSK